MDRWLPPRAPGGKPAPRFDAAPAPPDPPKRGVPDDEPAGAGEEPDTRTAPTGWQPPTARRDPPGAASSTARADAGAAATGASTAGHGHAAGRPRDAAPTGTGRAGAASPVETPTSPGMYGRRIGPPPRSRATRPVRTQTVPSAAAAEPNPAAAWALVLGVVGVVLLLLSLGTLFVITLPCSTAAWVLARRALRQIERGVTARGAGQAQVALWLGRIGVVVGLGALIMLVVLSLAGFDFDQFRESLQRDLERRRDAAR